MTDAPARRRPCDACEQVRIGKELDAAQAQQASERELRKLSRLQQYDLAKLAAVQQNALDLAEDAATTEFQKAQWAAEFELNKLFHQTIAEVAKTSIDRSRDSAKYVQTAAAAIAGLYTGLLGLVFSITSNPLPIRGVYATAFLGLAVALATAYLAFIKRAAAPTMFEAGGSLASLQLHRTGYLTRWVNATVSNKRWALRSSVLSLAFGVAFIAAPFLASSRSPDVPSAPAAPVIPGQVAATVEAPARDLFTAQVESFRAASVARNAAVEAAARASRSAAAHEDTLNRRASYLALLCLVLALGGPWLYERREQEQRQTARSVGRAAARPSRTA